MAFKAALALFYFILLGSQLSHKFYLCANAPARSFKNQHGQSTVKEPFRPAGPALSNVKNYFSLSIDKRYKFKDKFAIPAPETSLQFVRLIFKPEVFSNCPCAVSPGYTIHPLRGPPSV